MLPFLIAVVVILIGIGIAVAVAGARGQGGESTIILGELQEDDYRALEKEHAGIDQTGIDVDGSLSHGAYPEPQGPPPVEGAQWDEVHGTWIKWDQASGSWHDVG